MLKSHIPTKGRQCDIARAILGGIEAKPTKSLMYRPMPCPYIPSS
jgi:hypothetical protein